MITAKEILMGRDAQHPLSTEQLYNLLDLLPRINLIRFRYGKPLTVSSGYRPEAVNAAVGGAKKSNHVLCKAVDFADSGEFATWCINNMHLLTQAGLYMEDPSKTVGWVHLQSTPTKNNPFLPQY